MTTIAEARAELIAALNAGGARASDTPNGDPPYVYVAGDGTSDATRVITGQLEASFRLTMVGGAIDEAAAARELDGLKDTVLGVVRGLDGWRFTSGVGRDGGRIDLDGRLQLQADAFASRLVDI